MSQHIIALETTPGELVRTFQPPSVARIVHYRTDKATHAAIVTEVEEDGIRISATVFTPTGLFFDQAIPYSETAETGTWCWPPRV
jgi:hypothetical protein